MFVSCVGIVVKIKIKRSFNNEVNVSCRDNEMTIGKKQLVATMNCQHKTAQKWKHIRIHLLSISLRTKHRNIRNIFGLQIFDHFQPCQQRDSPVFGAEIRIHLTLQTGVISRTTYDVVSV